MLIPNTQLGVIVEQEVPSCPIDPIGRLAKAAQGGGECFDGGAGIGANAVLFEGRAGRVVVNIGVQRIKRDGIGGRVGIGHVGTDEGAVVGINRVYFGL